MPPSSYLARIAQPVKAGDPVIWSVHGAVGEAARPVAAVPSPKATPSTRIPLAAPAAVTRATAAGRAAAEDGSFHQAVEPIAVDTTDHPTSRIAPSSDPAATAIPAARPSDLSSFEVRLRHIDANEDVASAAGSPAAATAVRRAKVTPLFEAAPAASVARHDRHDRVLPPSRHDTAADERRDPLFATSPEAIANGQPANRAARSTPSSAPPPRLHIGTIEIRTTAPGAPPPAAPLPAPTLQASAPRPTVVPLGRAYASRFGLAQG